MGSTLGLCDLMMTASEKSVSWRATAAGLPQKGRGSWRGAQDRAAPGRIFWRKIFWVILSMTFTLLFPGQKAEFRAVDMVDSKGELSVKLPKEMTISGSFQGSQEQEIKILHTRIPQKYLDSLENR